MEKRNALQILNYLKTNQNSMIEFLNELVRAESPSKNVFSQTKILNILKSELEELNYYVFIMPGKKTGGYLYARPAHRIKGQLVQLMIGHCDTVWAEETILKMPVKLENSKMTGPGVFDMKAGLTQIIYSLKAVSELDLNCNLTPVILINSDEEIGSIESTNCIKRVSRIANRAFILEPPLGIKGKLKTSRKGIGKFNLTIRGESAHAGLNPEKGVSAIMELSHQIQYLFSLNDFSRGISVNVGMIEGGTSPNVIAAESKAVIDVRVENVADGEFISNKILNLKPFHKDVEMFVDGYFGRPPMEKTKRNQKLWKTAKGLGTLIDINLEQSSVGGGSDGNTTSTYTATLDGLGTTGDGAHALHEFIFTDKLIERTALLTLLLTASSVEVV
jgi:glutamate carboxypeptidase